MTLRLKEKLVPILVSELYDLVFNRRAIARPNSRDLAGIERRLMQIVTNRLMQPFACISNKTLDLRLLDLFGGERKSNLFLIRRLRLECIPIDCPSIKTRRRSGFQPSDRKTISFHRFGKFNRCRFAGATG